MAFGKLMFILFLLFALHLEEDVAISKYSPSFVVSLVSVTNPSQE